MIAIKANGDNIDIKNKWSELDPNEFVRVVAWMSKFFMDIKPNLIDFRLGLLSILTGYSRSTKRIQSDDQDQINSNLILLANMLKFPVRPYYPDPDQLDVFPEDIRSELEELFPHEIDSPKLSRVLDLVTYYPIPNLSIGRNLLPKIGELIGPSFTIDENNIADSDISAREYVDASEFFRLYSETRSSKYLDNLVHVLYRPSREKYKPSNSQDLPSEISHIDSDTKQAVFFIFQYIQDYIMHRSSYRILFGGGDLKSNKISLGMNGQIYSLSKSGYGSTVEIGDLSLNDFFNLMLKQMIDEVATLRGAGWDDGKISRETKIDIQIITIL